METEYTVWVCAACGSENVWNDAAYYVNTQSTSIYGQASCDDCEGETNLIKREEYVLKD